MKTTVIDAGVGNLGNLRRALEHLGSEVAVTADPAEVAAARLLVLPGVGAFGPPREALRGPLEAALGEAISGGAALLGICVGYQLLFEAGEEQGEVDGLGLLAGRVRLLPDSVALPHIGWNRVRRVAPHPLLRQIPEGGAFYFVHSFAPDGVPEEQWLATTTHGRAFPAVAGRGRVFGAQFHPEKSGSLGLRFLANFLELGGEEGVSWK